MLTITDGGSLARALKLPIDLRLKRLLMERRDQLGGDIKNHARLIVVQPGDVMTAVERELGWSILTSRFDGLEVSRSSTFLCFWDGSGGDRPLRRWENPGSC